MSGWLDSNFEKGLVSVIIPTYNRAKFLEEALRSVWEQTYRPIECIVVDDGSTDETADLLEKMATLQNDSFRLEVVRQDNAGSQRARNRGTFASKGEFIQYLDSDDLLYPDKLAKQVQYLLDNPVFDCVFGDWEKGSKENKVFVKAYKNENLLSQIITLECPIHTLSFLMRRTLVAKTGCWDHALRRMQEIDFQLSALLAGGNFDYQSLLCGWWRHHEEKRIHNQTTVFDMLPFFQKWESILKERKMFQDDMGRSIAKWYMWFVSQSKKEKSKTLLPVLEETVRLNPSIAFYTTKKMRLLQFFLGQKRALLIWLLRYRYA